MAARPQRPAAITRTQAAGRVFDEPDFAPLGDRLETFQFGRHAQLMGDQNRFGARRDGLGCRRRVEIVRRRIDFREHRRGPAVPNGVRRGDESHRGQDHFVARTDFASQQRQVQRRRATTDRHGMPRAAIVGHRPLERFDARTLREPAALKHFGQGLQLFFADDGLGDRDHFSFQF